VRAAIQREKSLKRWYREWKITLVEERNPSWRDLFFEMSGLAPDADVALPEPVRHEVLGSPLRSARG
jgi:hypothetical protein